MNRYHKNLRTEQLNFQFLDMLKSCIKGIREQVNLIKQFLDTRKKELIQENRLVHNIYNKKSFKHKNLNLNLIQDNV